MIPWCAPLQVAATTAPRRDEPAVETVIVRSRRDPVASGGTVAASDDARTSAATQNDALRVVTSLPGVGRPSFDGGALILWGAAPNSSRVVVDGVPIPALYHSSGVRGVLHDAFVDAIEVRPAGFGAEYGRATGGVVILESRAPSGSPARLAADLVDASAVATSVRPELRASGGIRVGYLRSVLDATIGNAFDAYVAVPGAFDYQARVDGRARDGTRWSVFSFGSLDSVSLAPVDDDPARARHTTRDSAFHRLVVRLRTRDEIAAGIDVVAWVGLDDRSRRDAVGVSASHLAHSAVLGGLRASYALQLAPSIRLRTGVDIEAGGHDLDRLGSLAQPGREGDPYVLGQVPPAFARADRWSVRTFGVAPWIEIPVSLAQGRASVEPAIRVDGSLVEVSRALPPRGDALPRGAAHLVGAVQPRLAVHAQLAAFLGVSASYGLYAMPPDPEDLSATFGNPRLEGTLAHHGTVGLVARIATPISLALTGFVRRVEGVVSRVPMAPVAGEVLENGGRADTLGVQFVARLRPVRGISGWIAYTLSRSTIADRGSAGGRLSDFDQTHLLQAVARWQLPRGFALGTRFRLASGLPRTPVVGHALDNTTGDVQPLFGATNSDRLPLFAGLDLRADWEIRVRATRFGLWLDVLNITGQGSTEDVLYDPTYRERRYVTGIPFFADLGARVEF